jgi:hypothetical protein
MLLCRRALLDPSQEAKVPRKRGFPKAADGIRTHDLPRGNYASLRKPRAVNLGRLDPHPIHREFSRTGSARRIADVDHDLDFAFFFNNPAE